MYTLYSELISKMDNTYDFGLERRLAQLDPLLSKRYTGCVFLFENMLKKYTAAFPHFTDHTLLHSINVGNYSNMLLRDYIDILSADEIYCYLMGVLIHDVGMGVNGSNYKEFLKELNLEDFEKTHPEMEVPDIVRTFHNDFSFCFTMKYYDLFDVPDKSYAYAIACIGRGHRKVNLLDPSITPTEYTLENGSNIRLPLLAALIRVADELDMGSDRNPDLLYDNNLQGKEGPEYITHMKRHQNIEEISVFENEIVFRLNNKYPEAKDAVFECIGDVFKKLQYYVQVSKERNNIEVTQRRIVVKEDGNEDIIYTV